MKAILSLSFFSPFFLLVRKGASLFWRTAQHFQKAVARLNCCVALFSFLSKLNRVVRSLTVCNTPLFFFFSSTSHHNAHTTNIARKIAQRKVPQVNLVQTNNNSSNL